MKPVGAFAISSVIATFTLIALMTRETSGTQSLTKCQCDNTTITSDRPQLTCPKYQTDDACLQCDDPMKQCQKDSDCASGYKCCLKCTCGYRCMTGEGAIVPTPP